MRRSIDYVQTPRPIVALADEYPAGFIDPRHQHHRAQLLYASTGVMSISTDEGSFVVPPQRALWIPPGVEHEVACRESVSLRTLYFDPSVTADLPDHCRVLEISDLMRALILEAMTLRPEYDMEGREGLVMRLIHFEINRMPNAPLHVPMPKDPRLARVCRAIVADPAREGDLDHWAKIAGMGRRTLTRQFKQETGVGLAAWRQHVRLLEALSRLAVGQSVTTVAFDVGYESPSAFTAMFQRTFGVPPSRYFSKEYSASTQTGEES